MKYLDQMKLQDCWFSTGFRHIALWTLTTVMMMAACTSDDFVGDKQLHEANENGRPMSLNLTSAPQTRAQRTGADAASDLNYNFVVWGDKTKSDNTQTVFNNYQVNYVTNSANTTTTNSAGWEYVGYTNLPNGTATTSGISQTIKYWDYGVSNYNFFAYSLGKGHTTTGASPTTSYAQASAMTSAGYTLLGTDDELKACYISNKKTITPSASSGTEVELQFIHFASNVKMAFYETIPGYSVKEVKFYPSVDGTATTVPCLYTSSNVLPTQGSYIVSFNETSGKAGVELNTESGAPMAADYKNSQTFGTALTYTAEKEYQEAQETGTTPYIGRSSNQATPTDVATVLPNPSGTELHLKIDYTLLSRDGNGETIHVTGATATVPAVYAKWQPNYSYTYLFKISDNTNGSTGLNILGLSPITLDAVVYAGADGVQETITTVTDPKSVTTYQKGSDYATMNEYKPGTIYIVVNDKNTGLETLKTTGESGVNAKLYRMTVEVASGSTALVTEMAAENAIENPSGAKDDNGNDITDVTLIDSSEDSEATDKLSLTSAIADGDSPDGKEISFGTDKMAKFTATANTIYVFEYTYTESSETKKVYKVIMVGSGS